VSAPALPRLGFLGLGWIGRHRMHALLQSGACEVRGLCEPDATALAAARELAPQARVASSFGQLLEEPLDGVVIATPSAQHAEQALQALSRGLAVFCQKPLGRAEQEVRAVVEAARRADRSLGVDLSYRRTRALEELRRVVQSGELGEIFAANLVFHNAYGPDKPWFYDPKLAGGGALMDLGIHLIDLLLWVLDFPKLQHQCCQMFSKGAVLRDRFEQVEDFVSAQLTLEGGIAVQLACSWHLHAGRDCVIEASLYGRAGGVSLKNEGGSFYDFSTEAYSGTARRVLAAPPDAWGGRCLVDWAERLRVDRSFDPTCERLIDVAQVIDGLYAAAAAEVRGEACGS
jgi:predicted dehydrogenase